MSQLIKRLKSYRLLPSQQLCLPQAEAQLKVAMLMYFPVHFTLATAPAGLKLLWTQLKIITVIKSTLSSRRLPGKVYFRHRVLHNTVTVYFRQM